MNPGDVREYVVRPALQALGAWSQVAEDLVMGTAAQESHFNYLEQIRGPALGMFQMEPATFRDIWSNFIRFNPSIDIGIKSMMVDKVNPNPVEMTWNLRFAAGMCRVHYFRKREPLPSTSDPASLGAYWKKHYNTVLGKGTVEEFVANYKKYVVGSEIN
jgi:hypothetical protein